MRKDFEDRLRRLEMANSTQEVWFEEEDGTYTGPNDEHLTYDDFWSLYSSRDIVILYGSDRQL
jgi:hypothetical protein